MDEFLHANRELWNTWAKVNFASALYDVEGFVAGRSGDLDPVVRAGPGNVRGKSLLHLQCHFGMDTIRWARHGATVTGVDFSETAIASARALAARMGVPATFVHSDLYELPDRLHGRFDVVFTSIGVLGWLPDLDRWAQVVAHFLEPGGTFSITEVHPFAVIFDDRVKEPALRLLYPYFHGPEPVREEVDGCYSEPDAPWKSVQHVWLHTMSDIIGALCRAGLRIESLGEYPFLAWRFFPWMEQDADGRWRLPEHPAVPLGARSLPLMFSLTATRPLSP
jgi:2-polyprenyl-3-methyl-5-hydroxy-6-metoxy-1,4-benzoquinol methylase